MGEVEGMDAAEGTVAAADAVATEMIKEVAKAPAEGVGEAPEVAAMAEEHAEAAKAAWDAEEVGEVQFAVAADSAAAAAEVSVEVEVVIW